MRFLESLQLLWRDHDKAEWLIVGAAVGACVAMARAGWLQ
jgi:hypothetical protein